jgi:hypothetical protein
MYTYSFFILYQLSFCPHAAQILPNLPTPHWWSMPALKKGKEKGYAGNK